VIRFRTRKPCAPYSTFAMWGAQWVVVSEGQIGARLFACKARRVSDIYREQGYWA
jgi:hypothetical protein